MYKQWQKWARYTGDDFDACIKQAAQEVYKVSLIVQHSTCEQFPSAAQIAGVEKNTIKLKKQRSGFGADEVAKILERALERRQLCKKADLRGPRE